MKKLTLTVLCLIISVSGLLAGDTGLEKQIQKDMMLVNETWHILDQIAQSIWPGWTNYQEIPFRFTYPNGVELLIGHPSPPDRFVLQDGVTVNGKSVYIDRSREDNTPVSELVTYGGGVLFYGKEKQVPTADMYIYPVHDEADANDMKYTMDNTILMFIHELFHAHQRSVFRFRYGNLRYNPVTDFAVYAEIEGLALEKAYHSDSQGETRKHLADFLTAREHKRLAMDEIEGHQESEEELNEGTATYSELRACELLKQGFKSSIAHSSAPRYHYFKDADYWIEEKLTYLKENREETLSCQGNSYFFGGFQAVILSRLLPGWQEGFLEQNRALHEDISKHLQLTDAEMAESAIRVRQYAQAKDLRERHDERIKGRDRALKMIEAREGRSYVINFKPVHLHVAAKFRGEVYKVGLKEIAEKGIEKFAPHDILLTTDETPILKDQLYHVKWVDTETPPNVKGYSIEYEQRTGDVYTNAVITTKGFELRAPKVKVTDRPSRVKFTVLTKVSD